MDLFMELLIGDSPLDFWTVHYSLPNFVQVGRGNAENFGAMAESLGYPDRYTDTKSPAGSFYTRNNGDCLIAVPAFADPERWA